jgi:catechol 2,3-dioxygenase-like lactoylglutathione lyase family enzyme
MELFAGMPVSDLARAKDFYTRLLGRQPSFLPNDREAVWTLDDRQHVYVVEDGQRAGGGHVTLFVDNLGRWAKQAAERRIEPTTEETYANGVRKLEYHDPDGNQFGIGGGPREA